MPKHKDLKRVVRARMQKTGESYTTARLHVTGRRSDGTELRLAAEPAVPARPDYAALAGMSDDAVKKATGCGWEKWVFVLDHADGRSMSHREIVAHIRDHYHTPSWWTQTVAVGYERIAGLRETGQQRSGEWRASKSRTVAAPLAKVYAAFNLSRRRAQWLPGGITIRSKTPNKAIRLKFEDGTPVDVGFHPKGEGKTTVGIAHRRLQSKDDADRMKAWWATRLDALATMLAR